MTELLLADVAPTNINPVPRYQYWIGKAVPLAIAAAGLAWEIYALQDTTPGDTWSQNIRDLKGLLAKHIGDEAATVVWYAGFGTFSAWFASHIEKKTIPVPNN